MQGSPQVISDLQNAIALEQKIQLQYHLDCQLLNDFGLHGWADKADDWGEDSESIIKDATKSLIAFEQTPSYQAAGASGMGSPTDCLANWLKLENDVYGFLNEAYATALNAGDAETAHDFHDYIACHRKRIRWIEKKQRRIAQFGNDYILEETS